MVEQIARNVGVAFQIQDDILDVTSTSEVLGKPVHSDEKNEKTTYVTLMGIEEAGRAVEETFRRSDKPASSAAGRKSLSGAAAVPADPQRQIEGAFWMVLEKIQTGK